MENKLLEVGDKIAKRTRKIVEIGEVIRTTATQAIVKFSSYEMKFKRDAAKDGYLYEIGGSKHIWSSASYCIATEKDFNELEYLKTLSYIKNVNWSEVDRDILAKIVILLKE